MSDVSFDAPRLVRIMQGRLALLAPPEQGAEHEYYAGRRLRTLALLRLVLDTVTRHVDERMQFREHSVSVARHTINTFESLNAAIEDATRKLEEPKSAEARVSERSANAHLVQAARVAATLGRARELMLDLFSASHDLEMQKHYAGLVDLMEADDPERTQRAAGAIARTVFVQGTSIAIGTLILGPPGVLAGAAFGLLMDAPSIADAFRKHPRLARLDDRAMQELDEFDVALMNWCIATELMIRRLRQVREANDQRIDAQAAQAAILERFSELLGG